METEYLYRVSHKGSSIFESKERKEVEFFAGLMSEKQEITIERAELVWWPIPPEKSQSIDLGTT